MLFPTRATFPAYIISLDLIRLIIEDEKHTPWNSRLCIFIQLPVTSSDLRQNIFLYNIFSKHSSYVLPSTSQTKFHNNTKQHTKLQFCILQSIPNAKIKDSRLNGTWSSCILQSIPNGKIKDSGLNGIWSSPNLFGSQFLYACNFDLSVPHPSVRSLPHLQRIYCPHLFCNFDLHSVQ